MGRGTKKTNGISDRIEEIYIIRGGWGWGWGLIKFDLASIELIISSMASRRYLLQCVLNRICKGSSRRNFGALPQGTTTTNPSSSQRLITLEYECSAHK